MSDKTSQANRSQPAQRAIPAPTVKPAEPPSRTVAAGTGAPSTTIRLTHNVATRTDAKGRWKIRDIVEGSWTAVAIDQQHQESTAVQWLVPAIEQRDEQESVRQAIGQHGTVLLRSQTLVDFLKSPTISRIAADPQRSAKVLEDVRKRADSWRTSTAGVLTLITAALVVTNAKDTARAYTDMTIRWLLVGMLVLAAVLGMASLYKTIRAANGPSWLDVRISTRLEPNDGERDIVRARAAAHDLWWAQRLLAAAVLVFILLVALTWGIDPKADWPFW